MGTTANVKWEKKGGGGNRGYDWVPERQAKRVKGLGELIGKVNTLATEPEEGKDLFQIRKASRGDKTNRGTETEKLLPGEFKGGGGPLPKRQKSGGGGKKW